MSNGAYIVSIYDLVAGLGCSERSAWRWVKDLPRVRNDETGRFLFTLADVVAGLRGHRRGGLAAFEGAALVRAVISAARTCPADVVVGDPAPLKGALTGRESVAAGHYIAKARQGALRTLWSAMTPQQDAACTKIIQHPAVLSAILGDPSALPSEGPAWDSFAAAFAMANAAPATHSQTMEFENVA